MRYMSSWFVHCVVAVNKFESRESNMAEVKTWVLNSPFQAGLSPFSLTTLFPISIILVPSLPRHSYLPLTPLSHPLFLIPLPWPHLHIPSVSAPFTSPLSFPLYFSPLLLDPLLLIPSFLHPLPYSSSLPLCFNRPVDHPYNRCNDQMEYFLHREYGHNCRNRVKSPSINHVIFSSSTHSTYMYMTFQSSPIALISDFRH